MIIKNFGRFLLAICLLSGCTPDELESPIPYVFVNVEINVNQLQYDDLRTKGFVYLPGGVRGMIVYAEIDGTYKAFDRNCPFQPQDTCAVVDVDPSGFFMVDDCCSSTFDFNGIPTGGPARDRMREYYTRMEGNILIITSEPL